LTAELVTERTRFRVSALRAKSEQVAIARANRSIGDDGAAVPILRIEFHIPTSGQEPSVSDAPIGDLRRLVIADMTVRIFSEETQSDYFWYFEVFA
jgi:hypothetical protein